MSFGGYTIGAKDLLCSPDNDGNYVIMKDSKPWYTVDGVRGQVATCDRRGIPKGSKVTTFKLEWPKTRNQWNIDTQQIAIGTCSFSFKPSEAGWSISIKGCKDDYSGVRGPGTLESKPIGLADFELN